MPVFCRHFYFFEKKDNNKYMLIIENKTFTGNEGLVITEDALIRHCNFKNFTGGPESDMIQIHGPGVKVKISDCIFDQTGVDPNKYDEAVSLVHSAHAELTRCVFRNISKTILAGNGDFTYDEDKDTYLYLNNCLFDGCSRRNPYVRYGTLIIKNCVFKNWGRTFWVKSNCVRIGYKCKACISNCKFEMDKLIQTNFKNFILDWVHQIVGDMFGIADEDKHYTRKLIVNCFKHPIKFFKMFIPGAMKAISCEYGATAEITNCTKNHWWMLFLK